MQNKVSYEIGDRFDNSTPFSQNKWCPVLPGALWVTDPSSSLPSGSSLFHKPHTHTHPALGEVPGVHQAHLVKELTGLSSLWVALQTQLPLPPICSQFSVCFPYWVFCSSPLWAWGSCSHLIYSSICSSQTASRPLLCPSDHLGIFGSWWPLTPYTEDSTLSWTPGK